ncbi:hypothetical protein GOODEAATRI_002725, partial [Goodea atripinnis]
YHNLHDPNVCNATKSPEVNCLCPQTNLVSVEGLSRLIDPSQLTADLGGSLEYDHVEWTELRLGLEEFSGAATQLLAQLEQLEAGLSRIPEPKDVDEARKLAEAGHYGAERIALVSSQLQEDWKSLTATLEERSNTLAMATGFHQGAEQVSESGKALMDVLQRNSMSESDESAAKPDFTTATHTIMGVLHQVIQNTYTNAEKLLEAADQLAQSGECEEEEIYQAARDLELRMQAFIQRVEQRKLLLDLAVSFYTHTKEGSSVAHVESVLQQLEESHAQLEELFHQKKIRLDIYLQFRILQQCTLEVTGEMDAWKQDLQKQSQDFSAEKLTSPRQAETNLDQLAQDKLALGQSRLAEATPEALTLAQQRTHRLCCMLIPCRELTRWHWLCSREPNCWSGHYDPDAVRACAQTVALHWQTLMLRIEDRLKLVNASAAFYRTSQQVCGVLESLEQEYRREEDWCAGGERQPEQLLPLINKHMEQKEAFLKACTLARRNAEVFLKYIHRNSVTMANISGHNVTVSAEKVHLLIQLAESMLAKGHAHRTELRRCVSAVDKRYRDFTVRMGQYRHLLEAALGSKDIPPGLANKDDIVFGNIQDIYEFHNRYT